ncbi:retron system putative HNH endonuclease [Proteus sp. NMG38-2]|nr:TIGR02646 family protein [Proteus sp. NMG38-2]
MQKGFCAYCECSLKRKHIEHFRTRDSHTNLTFIWSNLFGSCGDSSQKGG